MMCLKRWVNQWSKGTESVSLLFLCLILTQAMGVTAANFITSGHDGGGRRTPRYKLKPDRQIFSVFQRSKHSSNTIGHRILSDDSPKIDKTWEGTNSKDDGSSRAVKSSTEVLCSVSAANQVGCSTNQASFPPMTANEFLDTYFDVQKDEYINVIYSVKCEKQTFEGVKGQHRISLPVIRKVRMHSCSFPGLTDFLNTSVTTRVEGLQLEGADVSNLRELFRVFERTSLTELRLRNNSLTEITNYVLDGASKIHTLDLSMNHIKTIESRAFLSLVSLEYLDLSMNHINTIERGAFLSLVKLKYLNLSWNAVESLKGPMFQNSPSLRDLFLDNNRIAYIDNNTFGSLENIEMLYLSDNPFGHLLANSAPLFSNCRRLLRLSLMNCSISSLSPVAFKGMFMLSDLILTNNRLKNIPAGAFKDLHNLQHLELASNRLTTVSKTWPLPPTLAFINLYNNSLSTIDEDFFRELNLKNLYLESNQITTLPLAVQMYLFHRNVTVSDNPWRCDCDLLLLVELVKDLPSQHNRTLCTTPLAGVKVASLDVSKLRCPAECPHPPCGMCRAGLQRMVSGRCECMEGTEKKGGLVDPHGCRACPASTYKPTAGPDRCESCGPGSVQFSRPSPTCVCAAGYYTTERGDCQKCPPGTYKLTSNVAGCLPCPEGSTESQCKVKVVEPETKAVSKPVQNSSDIDPLVVASISLSGFVVLCCLLGVVARKCWLQRKRRRSCKAVSQGSTRSTINHYGMIDDGGESSPSSKSSINYRCGVGHNLCIKEIGALVGRGAFGEVFEAQAQLNPPDKTVVKVAIKRLKDSATEKERKGLRDELEQMFNVGYHPNIIGLFGSAVCEGQFCIVMEYADLGDLLTYLKNECTFPLQYVSIGRDGLIEEPVAPQVEDHSKLMMFAWQISCGMGHLEHHKFIHRDLAARNCLLTKGPIAKVSDFGLSKDAYELGHYKRVQKDRVPFKWLSPEALLWGQYSSKSDVWAFGILLWELYTFGGTPYPQVTTELLRDLHENGYRLSKPPACPDSVYRIMRTCWRDDPRQRPSFRILEQALENLIKNTKNVEYMELQPEIGQGAQVTCPLLYKEEDLDDSVTSLEFVCRKKYNAYLTRQQKGTSSSGEPPDDEIAYTETMPMVCLSERNDLSADSNLTSGFKSMSSTQTM